MKRRHFLKLAIALPFVGTALTNAAEKPDPDPRVVHSPYYPLHTTARRATLTIIMGKSKMDKHTFAETFFYAKPTINCGFGPQGMRATGKWHTTHLSADSLRDPLGDCEYILKMGVNVVLIVDEDKEMKSNVLAYVYGGRSEIFNRADLIIRVEEFKVEPNHTNATTLKTWRCCTLKTRFSAFDRPGWSAVDVSPNS